ncbi:MAG: hypothetical protein WDN31_20880 [Hyphomicrobium sp.]
MIPLNGALMVHLVEVVLGAAQRGVGHLQRGIGLGDGNARHRPPR